MRRLAPAALAALCLWPAAPALAWWNCAWTQRAALDVAAPAAGASLAEAVLDAAALPGYPWSGADADLRIVDGDDRTLLTHYSEPRQPGVQRLRVWFRVPALAATPRRVYVYYGNAAAPSVSTASVHTATGVRMLTRRQTGPRTSTVSGFLQQFDAAAQPAGYGCAVLPDYVDESNAARFGAGTNVHYSAMFFLDVPASRAGTWRFRFGADFGFGGGLYVNGLALEEQWGDDLWWAGSFGNAQEVLEGQIALPAGRHLVVGYGTEDCCEGPQTIQARGPGGNWLDLTTANFTLVAPTCPVPGLAVARVPDAAGLVVTQAVQTISDPVSGAVNARSIPGARKRWSVRVVDGGNARAVDTDTVQVVVPVPAGTRLFVGDTGAPGSGPVRFVDGTPASGLSYAYGGAASTTDDVAFSRDGGATWAHAPVPGPDGTDPTVTHLRITPRGKPACTVAASPGAFELQFDAVIR